MSNASILLVRNPRAGSFKAQNSFMDAAAILFESGRRAYLYSTQGPGDAARIVAEHGSDYDMVVCFGGDGTLNEVINGIMCLEKQPVLGYIPAGTTNDFAQGLGLSKNIIEAAEDIIRGETVTIDIGLINHNRYFSYVASFGTFTEAAYSAPQDIKNVLGYPAYLIEGIKNLGDYHPYEIYADIDGEIYEGEFVFGGISNSTSMGGILKLDNNGVDLSDGLFEILLIRKPRNLSQLQKIIHSIATHNYGSNDQIIFTRSDKITIICEKPLSWTVDGEYGGLYKNAALVNCHNVINIIKPF